MMQLLPFKVDKLSRDEKAALPNSTGLWGDDLHGLTFKVNPNVLGQVEAAGLEQARYWQ